MPITLALSKKFFKDIQHRSLSFGFLNWAIQEAPMYSMYSMYSLPQTTYLIQSSSLHPKPTPT